MIQSPSFHFQISFRQIALTIITVKWMIAKMKTLSDVFFAGELEYT